MPAGSIASIPATCERPWKAPTWLIGLNTVLAFVNALFLGAGAKVWGY